MATISENLQTIKNSTDAIKQAIIDKGGTINGDITTWASAISGISGGSNENINNVYVSLLSSYVVDTGGQTMTAYISFENPVDVAVTIYIQYHNGDTPLNESLTLEAGKSECSVEVNLRSLDSIAVSVIPSYYYGQYTFSSYLYKINYL